MVTTTGQDAEFYIDATNPYESGASSGLTYKWYKYVSGGAYTLVDTNVDDGNFVITNVDSSDAGSYYCVVEVTAESDSVTSDYVKLALYNPSVPLNLYVATDGDDDLNNGLTRGAPLASIAGARDMIRGLDSLPTGSVTVWVGC